MIEDLGDATLELRTDHRKYNRGIDDAKRKAQGLEARFQAVGRSLSGIGTALLPVSAAVGFVGIASIKAASDFESSFAGVRKTVDATEEEFAALSQGFRDMAKEIPVSVNELNRIGEAAGQLGIETKNILSFTRTMADLGVTTNLSAEQAATALARLANITGLPQDQFDRLGSTIVELGNTMATTEAEIVDFGLRIAGAGEIAGLTEAQILAIGAAMSSVGIEAAAGGTAVQKVLLGMTEAVASGGEKLADFANAAGMSAQQFADAFEKDAAGAFTAFVEGLGVAGDDAFQILADLGLEDERLKRAFLSLAGAGDLLATAIETGTDAFEENTALAKEAAQRYETFASQMTLLKNELQDAAITFGTAMLPVMRDAIDVLKPLIASLGTAAKWFADMPAPIRLVGLALGAIVTAAAPVLLVLGTLVSSIGTLTGLFVAKTAATVADTVATAANTAAQVANTTAVAGLITTQASAAAATTASGAAAAGTAAKVGLLSGALGTAGLVLAAGAAGLAIGRLTSKYIIGDNAYANYLDRIGFGTSAIDINSEAMDRNRRIHLETGGAINATGTEMGRVVSVADKLTAAIERDKIAAEAAAKAYEEKLTTAISSLGITTKDDVLGVIKNLNTALDAGIVPVEQLAPKVHDLIQEWKDKGLIDGVIETAIDGINDKLREQGAIVEQLTFDEPIAGAVNFAESLGQLPPVFKTNAFAAGDVAAAVLGLTQAQGMAITSFAKNGEEAAILASKLRGDYGPAIQAATERMLGLDGASRQTTGGLFGFIDELRTGIPVVDGFLGKIKGFLGIFKSIGSALSKVSEGFGNFFSKIGGMFKGGGEDAGEGFTDGITGVLKGKEGFMGKISGFLSAAGPWIAIGLAVAGPLLKGLKSGLKAIGGFFKGLFGGPNAAEVAGRSAAAAFRDSIRSELSADVLIDVKRLFPAEVQNAAFLASIQQKLIAAGVAAEAAAVQARDWGVQLGQAEKKGGAAVQAVIDQITAATQVATDSLAQVASDTVTTVADVAKEVSTKAADVIFENGATTKFVVENMTAAYKEKMDAILAMDEITTEQQISMLEALKQQHDLAMQDITAKSTTASKAVADSFAIAGDRISNTFRDMDIRIPVNFDVGDLGKVFGGEGAFSASGKSFGVTHLAHGGVIDKPTVALIGESGPEAVVPLSKGGGGGGSIDLTISAEGIGLLARKTVELTPEILRSLGIG